MRIATSGFGPIIDWGVVDEPTDADANVETGPLSPIIRSSQPVRSVEPGAAFSIVAMASKCDRVGLT